MKHYREFNDAVSHLDKNPVSRKNIFGPWIQERNLVLLWAQRGLGKTFFGLKVAQTICSAGRFLNYSVDEPRTVAFVDGELGLDLLVQRVSAMCGDSEGNDFRGDRLRLCSLSDFSGVIPNLSNPAEQKVYDQCLDGADVIIIDNLNVCARRINHRDDDFQVWERVQRWAIQKRELGKTVIFIHHAGKSGTQLGTSQKENVMDTIIALKPTHLTNSNQGAQFEIHVDKARLFKGKDTQALYCWTGELDDGRMVFLHEPLEEKRRESVLALKDSGVSPQQIGEVLRMTTGDVKVILASDNVIRIPKSSDDDGDF